MQTFHASISFNSKNKELVNLTEPGRTGSKTRTECDPPPATRFSGARSPKTEAYVSLFFFLFFFIFCKVCFSLVAHRSPRRTLTPIPLPPLPCSSQVLLLLLHTKTLSLSLKSHLYIHKFHSRNERENGVNRIHKPFSYLQ